MAESTNAANPIPRAPNFRRVLWLDIALPVLAVLILERNGSAPLVAYAAASLFPVASVTCARQRSAPAI